MIQVRYFSSKYSSNYELITPTIFPDGTSQCWKVSLIDSLSTIMELDSISVYSIKFEIKWNFESENELTHLAQLKMLLDQTFPDFPVNLYMPYLPYARQDKEINNTSTFAKATLVHLLNSLKFDKISSYDIHSKHWDTYNHIENIRPDHFLEVIKETKPDVLFFPDKGAQDRYSSIFINEPEFQCRAKAYGEKVRDQATGKITGYTINNPANVLAFANVLIIDDLIDAGGTFIEATKQLKQLAVSSVYLCVSHGIFSKFLTPLWEAGISNIYTTDSYLTKKALCDDDSLKVFKV